jgi:hypothetical protein
MDDTGWGRGPMVTEERRIEVEKLLVRVRDWAVRRPTP